MTITALPTPPSRANPSTFSDLADAFLGALPTFAIEANIAANAMNLNDTIDASASSVAIGMGAKVFTVSASKSFVPGMWLVVADTAAPSTNQMLGTVTSYSGTTLTMDIKYILGSGTKTAWKISQSCITGIASPDFYPDPTQADQGAATVAGNLTVKDFVDSNGTSKIASMVVRRGSTGNNTDYTFLTSATIPDNITLIIEPGARLVDAGGSANLVISKMEDPGIRQVFNWTGSGAVSFADKACVISTYPDWWIENTTPGTTDMTGALIAAYAACNDTQFVGAKATMRLRPVTYRFTSQLVWNKYIDVIGESGSEDRTVLYKDADITGIVISNPSKYENFSVIGAFNPNSLLPDNPVWPTPAGGYNGIWITNGNNGTFENICSTHHDGYGIFITYSLIGKYDNLQTKFNGSDGMRFEDEYPPGPAACWANSVDHVDTLGNGGWGFNLASASANVCKNIVCQQNGSNGSVSGLRLNAALANYVEAYLESNYGTVGLEYTVNSTRNEVFLTHADACGYSDSGTDNRLRGSGLSVDYLQAISRTPQATNIPGKDLVISGGAAGSGAAAKTGGSLYLSGGSAAGTGNEVGGQTILQGGEGVGTGDRGALLLQPYGGTIVVGNVAPDSAGTSLYFNSTTQAPRFPNMTTTQRDAITLVRAGMVIYNTTNLRFEGYKTAYTWVPLPFMIEATPASASAAGVTGDIRFDGSYLYICIATDTWRRVAHDTW